MLDFFKRRREEKAERAAQAQRNREAEQLGRDFATALMGAVDAYFAQRIRPHAEQMWGVFARRAGQASRDTINSPVDSVRIEARVFLQELGDFQDDIPGKCADALPKWMEGAEQFGGRDLFDSYAKRKALDLYMELFERTTNYAGDMIIALKADGHVAVTTPD